jgi:glycosyltransferase involved in cell wall biosynthesis
VKTLIIEISPLWELQYTGVPNVVYEFTRRAIRDTRLNAIFSIFGSIIPLDVVRVALSERSGRALRCFLGDSIQASDQYLDYANDSNSIFLFTNTCNLNTHGRKRTQIIYDLSYFSFADYHTADNVAFHSHNFFESVRGNSINFCISEATSIELKSIMGDDQVPNNIVIPLGPVEISHDASQDVLKEFLADPASRILSRLCSYFLFISTIEPRKNLDLLLSAISCDHDLLCGSSLVIAGRDGWNINFESLVKKYSLENLLSNGTIIRIPYISDVQKFLLLKFAKALIYPSVYEGFGLPVLEAIRVHTPVIVSCATSIPEVAGRHAIYFDPYSVDSFCSAIKVFTSSTQEYNADIVFQDSVAFCYNKMYELIVHHLLHL